MGHVEGDDIDLATSPGEADDNLQMQQVDYCACVCGCGKLADAGVMCKPCRAGHRKNPDGKHGVK